MTETRTQPNPLDQLDFDVPCDQDDRAAVWIGIVSCCGENGFFCAPCAVNARIEITCRFAAGFVTCGHCGAFLASPRDVRWEPVR